MRFTIQYVYYGVATFVLLVAGFKWAWRRVRRCDIEHVFIRDMATNHLPHIYTALELIGEKLEVPIADSPQIKFLDNKDFEGL